MSTEARPPVFVVGALRSGTTVFRLMLTQHPQVEIFGEFEESVRLLVAPGWPDLARTHRFLARDRAFLAHGFRVDPDLSYPDLMRSFLEQARARTPKPWVGASVHSHFERLPDLWPDARYVHVLRDPRDVARSCIGMGWVGHVRYGAEIWRTAEERWQQLAARVPAERRHEVRYEALIREPAPVLEGVCRFLGLSYSDAMARYDTASSYGRPDPSRVEQWRRCLGPREVRHVEGVCRPLLEARGYAASGLAPLAPGPLERAGVFLRHRGGRAASSIRRYGLAAWLAERLARGLRARSWAERLAVRRRRIDESALR